MEAEGGGSGLVGRDLSPLLRRFSSDDDSTDTVRQFVSGVGNVLNRHWATFDSTAMRLGLLGLVESLLSNVFLMLCTTDLPTLVVKSGSILLQLSQLLGQQVLTLLFCQGNHDHCCRRWCRLFWTWC
jgi:hypothetical protein